MKDLFINTFKTCVKILIIPVLILWWPTSAHGKTKIHGTANFTNGKTKLTHSKTPLIHGKTKLTHRKTKLTHGKTKLTHGKTKFTHGKTEKTSWSAVAIYT